jgi:hypothetical protein
MEGPEAKPAAGEPGGGQVGLSVVVRDPRRFAPGEPLFRFLAVAVRGNYAALRPSSSASVASSSSITSESPMTVDS